MSLSSSWMDWSTCTSKWKTSDLNPGSLIQCLHTNIILYLPHHQLQLCSECWVMTKTEYFNCSRRHSIPDDCVLTKRGNLDAEIARHRRKLVWRHSGRRPWEEGRLEWSVLQAKGHQRYLVTSKGRKRLSVREGILVKPSSLCYIVLVPRKGRQQTMKAGWEVTGRSNACPAWAAWDLGEKGSQVPQEKPQETFPQGHSLSTAVPWPPHTVPSAKECSP